MRVMVIVKSNGASEAGNIPSERELSAMGAYNDELIKAGVMLNGEGLLSSALGKRVHFSNGTRSVIDGPFTESKELVAGFWIWKVKSLDEAVEWAKRMPDFDGEDSDVELRQVAESEDFGDNLTPELKAQEERQRKELEARQG
jgi:hypothetical protein